MIDLSNITIPTYVMNLPERTDRRIHTEKEFAGRPEFDLHIIPAVKCERGADGWWKTFYPLIEEISQGDDDVVIVCEDDHAFTPYYDRFTFLQDVITAAKLGCQLMMGGIGNYSAIVPLTERIFWMDWCWCAQFMVLYRPSFEIILNSNYVWGKDISDLFLSEIIPNKMGLYPFISIQKEFGYSDLTEANNVPGTITHYMNETSERVSKCYEVARRYNLLYM